MTGVERTTPGGLSNADFNRLQNLIHAETGIFLGPEKKTMLEIRLKRRLRSLDYATCAEYCEHVFSREGRAAEFVHLIDTVTTNKTDFFREPDHFDHLVAKVLPEMEARCAPYRKSLVWSAGCSTGEEPYTLAMVMDSYQQARSSFHYRILATDICTAVLDKARLGIFRTEAVRPVPQDYRRKYLMRSRDPNSEQVRVVPELRSKIEFRHLNLMDADFGFAEPPDIIFCRNVIIYFDRPTQLRVLEKMIRRLAPGGYFYSGHSESLQNMDLPLVCAGPAVYRKTG